MAKSKLPYSEHIEVMRTGSPEHALLLRSGYRLTAAEAEMMVKQRESNPVSIPWQQYQDAKAMLAALATKPEVVSDRPAWKRSPRRRS